MIYDVIISGGGPAGLSAALGLGRARRRVLLCDAGEPRNAAAEHLQGFVTRDGTAPAEFRRIARSQLEPYANVQVRPAEGEAIAGERGSFQVELTAQGTVAGRRVLLCTGMVDQMLDYEGFRELWGRSIFQCPYCHGWEAQDRSFGLLATSVQRLEFALLLRAWTSEITILTDARGAVPTELGQRLQAAGVHLDERPIRRLVALDGRLKQVEFERGPARPLDVLFAHPPQRHVPFVEALGLELDPFGFLRVDEMRRETSRAGIYAAGDSTTFVQGAIAAAASGMLAAGMINHDLMCELAPAGLLER